MKHKKHKEANGDIPLALLLNIDGSVKMLPVDKLASVKNKYVKYILLPDDDIYHIINPSDYLKIDYAEIEIELSAFYQSIDDELIDDEFLYSKVIKIDNPYDLYLAIWNPFKMLSTMNLLYEYGVYQVDIYAFDILKMNIECHFTDNSVDTFEWSRKGDIDIVSSYRKLCAKLAKKFKLSKEIIVKSDDYLVIEDDSWSFIKHKKLKEGSFIGIMCHVSMSVKFIIMEHEYNEFIESVRYCSIMVMLNSICKQDQDMKNAFDTNTKRVTLPKSFDMDEVNNYSFMSEINIYHKSDCYSLLVIMSYLIEYIRSICAVMVEGTDVSNLSVIFRFKGVDYYGRIGHYGTHTTLIRGDI